MNSLQVLSLGGSGIPGLVRNVVILWVALLGIIMYDARQVTTLRFASDNISHAAFLLFWLVLPWLVVVLAMWYEWPILGEGARVGRLVVLTILTLCFAMIGMLSIFSFTNSVTRERVTMGRDAVVLEAVTCGPTCSTDLVLRQEWRLVLPGLVRSRQLGDWYRRSDGHVSMLDRSRETVVLRLQAPASSDVTIEALDTVLVISRVP